MRNFKIIGFITLMGVLCLTAQNKNTKKADQQFSQFKFVKAAKSYTKLIEKGQGNTYVYKQLAACYYNSFDTAEAEHWYAKALKKANDAETIYNYSQVLKANGKYEASNEQMRHFASMYPLDDRAIAYRNNPDYLYKIRSQAKKFNIQNVSFNSAQSDFGGTVQGDKIYIASGRNNNRKNYEWNLQPFLDIYSVSKNSDGSYKDAMMLNKNINTKFHEGIVSFSPDGETLYFSRESFFENAYENDSITKTRYSQIYLYKATKTASNWDTVERLNLNNPTYSVKNPSVSVDGKTLYFASNMPGGYGNFDIYKAAINADGTLGKPHNLGQKVNTQHQDMFPYISSTNTLYFSSNGHLGLGGMDVFYTKAINGKMAPIRNVGTPINSNADDFAFSINESTEKGFVSSNREGGKGSDDVYAFKKLQPLCDVLITAVLLDNTTGLPISGASVILKTANNTSIASKASNEAGKVEFVVECEKDIAIEVTKQDYNSKALMLKGTREETQNLQISLNPLDPIIAANTISLNPIYFNFNASTITAQAVFELDKLIQIMNTYPKMSVNVISHTDTRGGKAYNKALSNQRAKAIVQYIISKGIEASRILGIAKGESELKIDCGTRCTEEQHQENRRSEFIIISGSPQFNIK